MSDAETEKDDGIDVEPVGAVAVGADTCGAVVTVDCVEPLTVVATCGAGYPGR